MEANLYLVDSLKPVLQLLLSVLDKYISNNISKKLKKQKDFQKIGKID